MPKTNYDVVVVGAGPAGSVAALTLARAGNRVALLDRATFPRAKICGNCINPRAWKVWDKLGLTDSFEKLPHAEIAGLNIECEGKLVHRETFRPPVRGPRAVSREVLDDWLRREGEAAGVEFFPATTVTGIGQDGTVQTSTGEFGSRLIIGADGRNSVVARHSGLMPAPVAATASRGRPTSPHPPDSTGMSICRSSRRVTSATAVMATIARSSAWCLMRAARRNPCSPPGASSPRCRNRNGCG